MKKIAIILDTNIAHNPKKLCKFDKLHIFGYDNTIEFIERHDLTESVEVFIPEIVLKEVIEYRKRNLKSGLDQFKNLCENFNGTNIFDVAKLPDEKFNCAKYIDELEKRKMKQNVCIVPIPTDRTLLFNKILEMAVKKYPPFQKDGSDKGFKDAIILLSIYKFFKDKKEYSEIYLFSEDNGYIGVNIDSVEKKHCINFHIIKGNTTQEFLADKYKLKIELREYLQKESFISTLQKSITNKIFNNEKLSLKLASSEYQIVDIVYESYSINEINECECEVYCPVSIEVKKNGLEISDIKLDFTVILFKNAAGEWNIKSFK